MLRLSRTRTRSSESPVDLASPTPDLRRYRGPKACVIGACSGARQRAHCVRLTPKSSSIAARSRSSSEAHTRAVLPWGSLPYDVFEMWAATRTGIASPGCATSSGFLNLVTSCSALIPTALFHAESVHGVEALRGFPLPVAATALTARCPFSSRPAHRPGASAPARRPTPRRRPAPKPCSGIRAPGRSVHDGVVLPTPSADPLSAFSLSEGIST